MDSIAELTANINAFRDARDWRQFHNPKDMAVSISIEAAELLEHFQWKNEAGRMMWRMWRFIFLRWRNCWSWTLGRR